MRKAIWFIVLVCALFALTTASYADLNYDPLLPAPAPVLDSGWTYDVITSLNAASKDSPYVYDLAAPALFRITDDFLAGDTYFIFDSGTLILTTTFSGAMPALGGDPAGWLDSHSSKGEVLLSTGHHNLLVTGDGKAGLSAGFYSRLDSSLPEPSLLACFGILLGGLAGLVRRRIAQ